MNGQADRLWDFISSFVFLPCFPYSGIVYAQVGRYIASLFPSSFCIYLRSVNLENTFYIILYSSNTSVLIYIIFRQQNRSYYSTPRLAKQGTPWHPVIQHHNWSEYKEPHGLSICFGNFGAENKALPYKWQNGACIQN
jgi:hypothetical protein